ncbi:MAG: tetratricopeptide repeat protein, partial [Janthinobacterium lividum]
MNENSAARLQQLLGYLESDPHNSRLADEIVDLALENGDTAIARRVLAVRHLSGPENAQSRYRMAVLLNMEGRLHDSLEVTKGLIESGHNHCAIARQHGLTLFGLKQYADAARVFEMLGNMLHEVPDATAWAVRALHHDGQLGRATDIAQTHLQQHPDDTAVMGMLSLLYLDQDDLAAAAKFSAQTLATAPGNPDALLAGGAAALAMEQTGTARELFERAAAGSPGNGRAILGLGMVAMLAQQLPLARTYLEQTVVLLPTHLGSWNALAWLQILAGELDAAQKTLEQAMTIDRNFAETHGAMAVVAVSRGELGQARRFAEIALRLQPQSVSARYASSLIAQ